MKGLIAAEYSGCMFVLACVLMTTEGEQLCNNALGHEEDEQGFTRANNFLYLFEMFMCFKQWARKPTFWSQGNKKEAQQAQNSICRFLGTVKHIANQTEGHKWKFTKFHELLHLVWYMERFGSPRNVDAGMGKKNHQILAKMPVTTAQKQYASFDEQSQ